MRRKINETKELIQQLRLDMEQDIAKQVNIQSQLQSEMA